MVRVYDYMDYRKYLKDYYNFMKETSRHFSYRYFAQKAGFKSGSVYRWVMNGERKLTDRSITQFIKGLGLRKREGIYFHILVKFNQETDEKNKENYYHALISHSRGPSLAKMGRQHYDFYREWYFTAIWLMTDLDKFREDPKWIAENLQPKIRPLQAKHALQQLKDMGFLIYNQEGRLVRMKKMITTGEDVTSMIIRGLNRHMLEVSAKALGEVEKDRREISSLQVSMSKECFNAVREMSRKFKNDVLDMVEKECHKPDNIYTLNVQLVPLMQDEEVHV